MHVDGEIQPTDKECMLMGEIQTADKECMLMEEIQPADKAEQREPLIMVSMILQIVDVGEIGR